MGARALAARSGVARLIARRSRVTRSRPNRAGEAFDDLAPITQAGGSPNDLVCRYEQDTGSHLKKRTCTTRAVRDEQEKAARETMARAGTDQDTRNTMSRAQSSPTTR